MIIDLGDAFTVRYEVRDPITRALTDATVTLTVTSPAGVASNPSVTHTSTGTYDATFLPNAVGVWRYVWASSGAITDTAYGEVTVADPAPADYATLSDLKLATGEIVESTRDGLLLAALTAASRNIDAYCGRRFYADKTASARQFRTEGALATAADGQALAIDDLAAAPTTVETGDGVTWTAVTDYLTEPTNATVRGWPITALRRLRGYWPVDRVRVTGCWGWPTVPAEVSQATLLLASRLFNRRNSPEGVTGNADWGVVRVTRVDPDVATLLAPYVVMSVG